MNPTIFITLSRTPAERAYARVLINSLRAFGGELGQCAIWVFDANPQAAQEDPLTGAGIDVFPLKTPASVCPSPGKCYFFAEKVFACTEAERMAPPDVQNLVWMAPEFLVVKPPVLLDLGTTFDVAVRPVHVKNVGVLAAEPLDDFWRRVCEQVGVNDIPMTTETFVGAQQLHAYFNSHVLSVNPSRGLCAQWFKHFEALVGDEAYQHGACKDVLHKIFLHQAVLSVLLATEVTPQRLRILPPDYSYPYNLHAKVPPERRAQALNDLVCLTYEERVLDPDEVDDIAIQEPLRAWLAARDLPRPT